MQTLRSVTQCELADFNCKVPNGYNQNDGTNGSAAMQLEFFLERYIAQYEAQNIMGV